MQEAPHNDYTASPELWDLASRSCNDELSAVDQSRLDALLAGDEDARTFYGLYMLMHAELLWRTRGGTRIEETEDPFAIAAELPPPSLLATGGLDSAPASLLQTTGSGWLHPTPTGLAYVVATIVLGVGMLAASAWRLSDASRPLADTRSHTAVPEHTKPQPAASEGYSGSVVAKVTGMVDCRWADPLDAAKLGALVPLGRKYVLLSGKLELTYILGARVVVEGPADYEVDSPNSGFLCRGKLDFRNPGTGWGWREGEKVTVDTGARTDWSIQRTPAPGRYPAARCPVRFLIANASKTYVVNRDGQFTVAIDRRGEVRTWLKQGSVELVCRNGLHLPAAIASPGKTWGFADKDINDRVVRLICSTGEAPPGVLAAFAHRRIRLGDSAQSAGGPLWFENERGRKPIDDNPLNIGVD